MKYNSTETELKNRVSSDFFKSFDTLKTIGNIDLCISNKNNPNVNYIWAEAKTGKKDLKEAFVQLILTIGKQKLSFGDNIPPKYLAAFNGQEIAFIPYDRIMELFSLNDFNWNITPSDHSSKDFKLMAAKIENTLNDKLKFNFEDDAKELKGFLKEIDKTPNDNKIHIDKNNFINVYNKWNKIVKPSIAIDWDEVKKHGILDGDFYLADLLSKENKTLKEKLFVLLRSDSYELDRVLDKGLWKSSKVEFKDKQQAHKEFWSIYSRPPKQEYWEYIVGRRDLLVPQDVRERKGSYFTPRIWVEKSQEYLAKTLGDDWQDEYYIWDCAAGTGNLLVGLTNKYKIFASTLDKADVDAMHSSIDSGKLNLVDGHVFQFDFLNDDFSNLPKALRDIVLDPEKRKKLLVYINPPYAEAGSNTNGKSKVGVANNKTRDKYLKKLSSSMRDLSVQFLARIFIEIEGCKVGEFSTLKLIQGPNCRKFRENIKANLLSCFLTPGDTFDNVKGKFPIGFKIWDNSAKKANYSCISEIYKLENDSVIRLEDKKLINYDGKKLINNWLSEYRFKDYKVIGLLRNKRNDFQNQNGVEIMSKKPNDATLEITRYNLNAVAVYFVVRKCIKADWLNDRDQFLYPNDSYKTDLEFQSDCFTYALFNTNIKSKDGVNHWIPFTEDQVGARTKFDSNFMSDYIKGKIKLDQDMLNTQEQLKPLSFSKEAKEVFNKGLEIWKYYHKQPRANPNASLYDIKEYFQCRNEAGKMNHKSKDEHYNSLIKALREALNALAKKIESKVYEHGFLLK